MSDVGPPSRDCLALVLDRAGTFPSDLCFPQIGFTVVEEIGLAAWRRKSALAAVVTPRLQRLFCFQQATSGRIFGREKRKAAGRFSTIPAIDPKLAVEGAIANAKTRDLAIARVARGDKLRDMIWCCF